MPLILFLELRALEILLRLRLRFGFCATAT